MSSAALESGRRALFGGPLRGTSPVYYIYVDEAGVSANEPVTIVAAILVKPDAQWRMAEARVNSILEAVPEKFREDFVFHAKSIWGDPKYRDGWDFSERLALIKAMMEAPRFLNIPMSIGLVRRAAPRPSNLDERIKTEDFQHFQAFNYCIARADAHIRKYGEPQEIATVVAEDTPGKKRFIRGLVNHSRKNPFTHPEDGMRLTQEEVTAGFRMQNLEVKIERVIDAVHFVEKRDAPLLQMADACAFGFRRYFANQSFGEEFVRSINGRDLVAEDWVGFSSSATFHRMVRLTAKLLPVWNVSAQTVVLPDEE